MKVICDVCGTTFPETATNCPICGCAMSRPAQTVPDDAVGSSERSTANTYAKGGRFAKSNVKRNNRNAGGDSRSYKDPGRRDDQGNNVGLIAVVVILLLACIMVLGYIGYNVFFNNSNDPGDNSQVNNGSQDSDDQNGETILCTAIKLNSKAIYLDTENESYMLAVMLEPENTTETVTFESSDPTVAVVDEKGNITPVGYGTAVITVTCGSVSEQCAVTSAVGTPPEATQPDPTVPTLPDGFVLTLKTYKDSGEITLAGDGVATLYSETMGIKASDITWTTSDPAIATVEDGKVTGVGKGYCYITAAIGDQTATCKVICTSDATPPSDYSISHVDVTIAVGETFNLSLKNKETGANVQGIAWQATQDGIVTISGNKITGQTVCWSGIEVFVEYEGVRYACRIIVKSAS